MKATVLSLPHIPKKTLGFFARRMRWIYCIKKARPKSGSIGTGYGYNSASRLFYLLCFFGGLGSGTGRFKFGGGLLPAPLPPEHIRTAAMTGSMTMRASNPNKALSSSFITSDRHSAATQ
ncbi:hypothetical protein [Yersinia ruckeri]|uniref:hypothetical protein n=1 Tax=Yersinia ruckeri TaxID=29486 RepID=UPI0016436C85|nr:hypothetical protein [Yersinia ruckeri]